MPEENTELHHNVFISWSGNRSEHVARALRGWLPMVLQAAKPFLSKEMEKGSRWHVELARALESTKVGIICLTPENQSAPWLLFEAGALSKTVDKGTRVCTYLLAGLKPHEVLGPLSEFQHTEASMHETRRLLRDINLALGSIVQDRTLDDLFDLAWQKLEAQISSMPEPESAVPPPRKTDDMVEEILKLSRAAAKSRESVERFDRYIPTFERLLRALEPHIGPLLAAAEAQPDIASVNLAGTIVNAKSETGES